MVHLVLGSTAVTSTAAELNLIDGGTARGTTAVADADGLLHNDGGTMRMTSAATFKTYFQEGISTAYDDLTAGDAAVLITTSSGNITIDAAANDSDIILKGTDGNADTTFLTIDGSAAGEATFNAGIVIADAGNIGSASDKDAIAIAADGVVTMNQIPVLSAGLNVSGGTIAGTISTATQNSITTMTGLVSTGALNSGTIATGFGNIDNGASNITTGGLLKLDVDADANDVTGDSATGRLTLGAGEDLNLYHGGTDSYIVNDTGDLVIKNGASDEDILFQGNDGGGAITALTLDMSAAGAAGFNGVVTANAGVVVDNITIDGTEIDLSSGDLTIDVAGDITLDADGGEVRLKDDGTTVATLGMSSSNFTLESNVSDGDIVLKGNDGGASITALTLDMSAAGAATFNGTLTTAAKGIAAASLPAGSVIQVVSAIDTTETSSTSSTMADTGLTVNITPSASSSKVLVNVGMNFGVTGTGAGLGARLMRGSTAIQGISEKSDGHGAGETSYHEAWVAFSYLDSPNTTSETTYKVQFRTPSGGTIFASIDGNVSSITVMEIAA